MASDVESVVRSIEGAIAAACGDSLVGLYLYGSLVSGDFDPDVSDVDLVAVLAEPPDEDQVGRLRAMHAGLVADHPRWNDRIDVVYVSKAGLATCRTAGTTIAVIAPGEPFHVVEAGRDWILTWYPARQEGAALIGPPVHDVIPPIPFEDFVEEVSAALRAFPAELEDDATPGSQAYAIQTMCRGLFTIRFERRPSKREATLWAAGEFTRWADLIHRAIDWRQHQWDLDRQDGRATIEATRTFLTSMARRS